MKLGTHILTGEKATAFQGFMLSGGRVVAAVACPDGLGGCCKCDRARNHTQVAVKILEKERIVALASVGLSFGSVRWNVLLTLSI